MLASQSNAIESPGTHLARSRPGFRIVACIVTKLAAPQLAYDDQVDRAGFVPQLISAEHFWGPMPVSTDAMSACSGSCHERLFWLACRQLSPPLKALLGTDNVWCDSRTEEGSQKFVLWAGCILERRSLLPRSLLREVP